MYSSALREATIVGLATGLVATGQVSGPSIVSQHKILRIALNGSADEDCALVDAAITTERFVAARALWRPAALREVVIAFGEPGSVGLAALASALDPVSRTDGHGLHVRLDDSGRTANVDLQVPDRAEASSSPSASPSTAASSWP